jgi:hypothetical protein
LEISKLIRTFVKKLLVKITIMENINLKVGDKVRVFDYGNEIFGEMVLIVSNDVISDTIIYKRDNGEKNWFSGQGYFE